MHVPEKYLRDLKTNEKEYDIKYLSKLPEYSTPARSTVFKNQDRQDNIKLALKENNAKRMFQRLIQTDHSADYEILGKEKYGKQLNRQITTIKSIKERLMPDKSLQEFLPLSKMT